jgi:hypothetical protein
MRDKAEIDNIVRDVQARLDARQRVTGVELNVPPGGYVDDDPWLNIIVTPKTNGVRAHEYVDALSEVEQELRASGVDHVLLVPAMAN